MLSLASLRLTGWALIAAPLTLAATQPIEGPASVGQPATAAIQDKPIEFVFQRPVQRALGITVKETHDLLLTSLTTQFGEREPTASTVAMRLRTRLDVALAEEYADAGPGPDALRRLYLDAVGEIQVIDPASVDDVAGTWNGVGIALKSPLKDVSVAFVPAEGQPDGHGRHFDGAALRESALPKLAVPTDWSQYLPPVKESGGPHVATLGDRWSLDAALLEPFLAPAGFMGWRTEKPKDGASPAESEGQILRAFATGVGGNLQQAFDGKVTGTAEARLLTVGVDPDNGRFGQIEIRFELGLRADPDAFVASRRLDDEGELDVDILGSDLEVRIKGIAVLNWGLDSGRPFSGLVNAEETVSMTVRVLPESGDVVSQTMVMKGNLLNGLTFKELPLSPVKRTIVLDGK
ncbi:MAG: hypothetical protein ACJAZN_003591 [Planctomycetota bacterium]|jgi:hypothetical protein